MSRSRGGFLPKFLVGASLLCALEGSCDALASVPSSGAELQPSAYFDLSGSPSFGAVSPGQELRLSIRLTAVQPPEGQTLVAILDGDPFIRRLVPLRFDAQDQGFHSTVVLEPIEPERTSAQTKAWRVRVTFARLRNMELNEFLVRSVYLTIGLTPEDTMLSTASHSSTTHVLSEGFSEERGRAASTIRDGSDEAFTEQNIIPSSVSAQAQVYWRDLSERLGQHWRQPAMRATNSPPQGPVVAVRFRLHVNGEAQLIQIERSSGVAEIDEAGLQAVLRAHPFPPFPADLGDESVDMHVEFGPAPGSSRSAIRQNSSPDSH